MLLGALVDAGADLLALRAGLERLGVQGWSIEPEPTTQHGLSGTRMHVRVADDAPQPVRLLGDVEGILGASGLPDHVRNQALEVFRRLAEAEARVHGSTLEEVHFHEVGAVDALVDIVGAVIAIDLLGISAGSVYASGVPLGGGWVRGEHGLLPVPAPATLELLRAAGAPPRRPPADEPAMELSTPTGAALLTTLASFRLPPFERVDRVGYGFGSRVLPWPNAVRVWSGDVALLGARPLRDTVVQLETNLDDATPEQLSFAMERLMDAGALDVAFSPLQMKKNRPGVLVRVLAEPSLTAVVADLLLAHTTALGVRVQTIDRLVLPRRQRTVETPWGSVRVKERQVNDRWEAAPEFEDCATLARSAGVPLSRVYDAARTAAEG
jgi:uncharacterized protein (TIGR00299 family) protein